MRSYGIYLWHWPIFLLTWPKTPSLDVLAAQVVATVVIAALSYWLIETPIRRGALARVWSDLRAWGSLRPGYQSGLVLGANAVMALVATLVIAGVQAQPPEQPDYFALDGIRLQSGVATDSQSRRSGRLATWSTASLRSPPPLTRMTLSFVCPASVRPGLPLAAACGDPTVVSVAISDAEDIAVAVTSDIEGALALSAAVAPPPQPPRCRCRQGAKCRATRLVSRPSATLSCWAPRPGWPEASPTLISILRSGDRPRRQSRSCKIAWPKASWGKSCWCTSATTAPCAEAQFEQIMLIAGPDRQVIFINTRVPRDWQDSNNAVLSAGAQRHANMTLIDWHGVTQDHPELFAKDSIHLNGAGAEFYTRLVIQAVLAKS